MGKRRPRKAEGRAVAAVPALGMVASMMAFAPAFALETLGPMGTRLAPAMIGPDRQEVVRLVAAEEGSVLATHVVLRPHGTSRLLQRTPNGYYVPYDGTEAGLIDAGLRPRDGVLAFKILEQDLAGIAAPLAVVLIARGPDGARYGELMLVPR